MADFLAVTWLRDQIKPYLTIIKSKMDYTTLDLIVPYPAVFRYRYFVTDDRITDASRIDISMSQTNDNYENDVEMTPVEITATPISGGFYVTVIGRQKFAGLLKLKYKTY